MEWEIAYHDERVQQDLLRFPQGLQVRYDRLTSMMEEFGPNLGMPHTRALGDGLFVLRLKEIVMLHSFVKKSQKTPKKELEIARKRLSEFRASQN